MYADVNKTGTPMVLQERNYYPFGLEHKGYNETVAGTLNRYKNYQGQELNTELGLNWLSFKYRSYDPAVGRFMTIDPLAEKYVDWAPYVFSGNRVIDARELEGLEPYLLYDSQNSANKNFAKNYNGQSILRRAEIGTLIYSIKTNEGTFYSYPDPVIGENDTVDPMETKENIPENGTITAYTHTHGAYDNNYDNNEFSDNDKKYADYYKIDAYVVTPNGSIQTYIEEIKEVKILSIDAPSDKNDPDRQNNISVTNDPSVKESINKINEAGGFKTILQNETHLNFNFIDFSKLSY